MNEEEVETVSEKKTSKPKQTRVRKPLAEQTAPAPVADGEKLSLFDVAQNQWGTIRVPARNAREARILLAQNPGKYATQSDWQVRVGRAIEVTPK